MTQKIAETKTTLDLVFDRFDFDGNGVLDNKELAALVAELGTPLSEAGVAQMMEDLDLNKDGVI